MELLKEYDFDALPYIDKEYDNPLVQDAVHQLISNEMRAFVPRNYISHLPYPKVRVVQSPAFQVIITIIFN